MYHQDLDASKEPMLGHYQAAGSGKSSGGGPPSVSESMSLEPMRLEPAVPECKDKGFAVAFLLQFFVMVTFALSKAKGMESNSSPDRPNFVHLSIFCGIMSVCAIFLATVWMKTLLSFADKMIRIALWMNVGFMIFAGITSAAMSPFVTLFFFLGVLINIWYIHAVENRIAFASSNLKCACAAIAQHPSIIGLGIGLLVVQFVWIVIWGFGSLGVYQLVFRDTDPDCAAHERLGQLCGSPQLRGLVSFCLLLSLYWGQQVIQNILTCTTAGTVATWWYQNQAQKVVYGAFYRSITYSFGSICFGSLLVAILQTCRAFARELRARANRNEESGLACLACLAECLLNLLENIMRYINTWAYCYVGIYGHDFRTSGKAVMALFENRGWTAVINDDLTSTVLGLSAVGVALVTAGVGVGITKVFFSTAFFEPLLSLNEPSMLYGTVGGISFLVGLAMVMVLCTVVTTALHTIFICFAEDPVAFRGAHPEHYEELVVAWKKCHPDAWMGAYGTYV